MNIIEQTEVKNKRGKNYLRIRQKYAVGKECMYIPESGNGWFLFRNDSGLLFFVNAGGEKGGIVECFTDEYSKEPFKGCPCTHTCC